MELKLEEMYEHTQTEFPKDNTAVSRVFSEWLNDGDSDKSLHMLYTENHVVEKLTN